jgi:hypothetical protein
MPPITAHREEIPTASSVSSPHSMLQRGMRITLFATLVAAALYAQTPNEITHDCHVYAVDIAAAEKLFKELMARPKLDENEARAASKKAEKILGRFKAKVVEEIPTTHSYPLPGTDLTVTATIFYTDEMMPGAESMLQGLSVGKGPVPNALVASGAAMTEVNFSRMTYKVRTKRRFIFEGKTLLVGVECQCMSDEQWKTVAAGAK